MCNPNCHLVVGLLIASIGKAFKEEMFTFESFQVPIFPGTANITESAA